MKVAEMCRDEAIKLCAPGVPYKAIGAIIEEIADEFKLKVVREFVGHGIGKKFHTAPQIIHHRKFCSSQVAIATGECTLIFVFALQAIKSTAAWKPARHSQLSRF